MTTPPFRDQVRKVQRSLPRQVLKDTASIAFAGERIDDPVRCRLIATHVAFLAQQVVCSPGEL